MSADSMLSPRQELVLAALPVPSAILSVLGSSTIIYMAYNNRRKRKSSPYTRLLVAMSLCDIIASINLSLATFARPMETSNRRYSFGNSATCKTVGFLNQMFLATIWYQTMLSIYFLLTARFGLSNKFIGKNIEPVMHIIAIGYSLLSSLVTLGMGAYEESSTMLGCWLQNSPSECPEGDKMCLSVLKGYFWLKIPILLAFTSVLINNLAILSFMRRQVPVDSNPKNKPAPITNFDCSNRVQWNAARTETQSDDERSHNDPESGSTSEENTYVQEQPSSVGCERYSDQKLYQQRRLHLVSSQAFLFVVSFFLCNVWTATGAMVESVGTDATEMKKLMVLFYPVFVCQAFFAPLQGFLNMMVYIRPRYLTLRHEYPRETRIWVIQRAILGEDKKPCTPPPLQDGQNQPTESNKTKEPTLQVQQQEHTAKVPHVSRVSSLTASDGDFDHISAGAHPEDRWKQPIADKTQAPPVSTRFHSDVRLSQLDIISEIEESVVSSQCSPMKRKDATGTYSQTQMSPTDERWIRRNSHESSASFPLPLPQRLESELECIMSPSIDTSIEQSDEMTDSSKDSPIRPPTRSLSPTPSSGWELVHA